MWQGEGGNTATTTTGANIVSTTMDTDTIRELEIQKLNRLEDDVNEAIQLEVSTAQLVTLLQERRRIIELRSLISGAVTLVLKSDAEYGRER